MATYAYIRVVTAEQEGSGIGLTAQRQRIQEQAEVRGWGELTWVVDEAGSDKTLDRPALSELLDRITAGDRLVVAQLDRLSRSTLDLAQLLQRSGDEGWSVVVLELELDTSTDIGQFAVSILTAAAELERGLMSERTAQSLQAAKVAGKRLGIGNRHIAPETLAAIVELRELEQLSMAEIANRLDAEGIPTVRGEARWYPSTVRAALRAHVLNQQPSAARP
jgi:DNA invertase Pin-like site-specific DNA recombinase